MEKERDAITFYRSYMKGMVKFPRKEWLGYLLAVINYGLDGTMPEKLTDTQWGMFELVKPNLDASRNSFTYGKKGGRPKKENPGFEDSKTNEHENEKGNEKENKNENEEESQFRAFWEAYPLKRGQADARREWACVRKEFDFDPLMLGLKRWLGSVDWDREDGRYIPKAEKWLRERWFLEKPKQLVPMGATGQLGEAEMEALQRLLREG